MLTNDLIHCSPQCEYIYYIILSTKKILLIEVVTPDDEVIFGLLCMNNVRSYNLLFSQVPLCDYFENLILKVLQIKAVGNTSQFR